MRIGKAGFPIKRLAAAVAVALACSGGGQAATVYVNTGGDADGTLATCTLRQAVQAINTRSAGNSNCMAGSGDGSDVIVFEEALTNATIMLGGTELLISVPTTIQGIGQTIDAAHLSRVFDAQADLTLSDMTLSGGHVDGNEHGGAIAANRAALRLSHCTIRDSDAIVGGGVAVATGSLTLSGSSTIESNSATYGGGIASYASVVNVSETTLSGNTANAGAAAYFDYSSVQMQSAAMTGNNGSAMVATHTELSASRLTLADNQGQNGAGAIVTNSHAVFDRATVSGNVASYSGGGFYVAGQSSVLLTNTTTSGNSAARGGGIAVSHGNVVAQQSLLSANSAQLGGAIYDIEAATVELVNSTVTMNKASVGGGAGVFGASLSGINATIAGNEATQAGGGIYTNHGATMTLANTILGGNSAQGDDAAAYRGTLNAQHCLLPTNLAASAPPTNLFSDSPGLATLHANGGLTQTLALLPTSQAVDAGDAALAQFNDTDLTTDQRGPGWTRKSGTNVDIGAYELQVADDRVFAGDFETP